MWYDDPAKKSQKDRRNPGDYRMLKKRNRTAAALAIVLGLVLLCVSAAASGSRIGSDGELLDALAGMREKKAVGFQLSLTKKYAAHLSEDNCAAFSGIALEAGMTGFRLEISSGGSLKLDDVSWTEPRIARCETKEECLDALREMLEEGTACCQIVTDDEALAELLSDDRIYSCATMFGVQGLSVSRTVQAPYVIYLDGIRYYPGKRIALAASGGEVELTRQEEKALAAARELADACRRESGLETARAIHDALCAMITYTDDPAADMDDNATGALLNGRANCDGYADAFRLVGTLCGLEVRCQHGDSRVRESEENYREVTHMWNIVKIGGSWRLVDVTWDDQEDGTVYTWFNIGADRARKTHMWDEEMSPPLLTETALPERPESEYLISGPDDAYAAAADAAQKRYSPFTLVTADGCPADQEEMLRQISLALNRSFSYSWNDCMQTMTVSVTSR